VVQTIIKEKQNCAIQNSYQFSVGTSHCSQRRSDAPTQAMHVTVALTRRTAPQLGSSRSTQLCCELASIAPVVTCPTSVTCFALLPVAELPASRTCGIKGEAFRAHGHLSERSESSQGVSSHIKGVTVQAALCASLLLCNVRPGTLPARTINHRLGCAPDNSTSLI
jgi:hypothetical protein